MFVDVNEKHCVCERVHLGLLRRWVVDNDFYSLHVEISVVRSPLLILKLDWTSFFRVSLLYNLSQAGLLKPGNIYVQEMGRFPLRLLQHFSSE